MVAFKIWIHPVSGQNPQVIPSSLAIVDQVFMLLVLLAFLLRSNQAFHSAVHTCTDW
jgi:hypothetical protein